MHREYPETSVVLPCRNEEESLEVCILTIKEVFKECGIKGEILVSDSSTDRSAGIAQKMGVILVKHDREGYGAACLEGFQKARGKYIFLADADGSYDFLEIPRFLECLRGGYEFVIGNRFKGRIARGAMPWLHRYIGNPMLSSIVKIFFGARISDTQCGMRALTREALDGLRLKALGMEFASEMVIKAVKKKLKIKELSINYHKRHGKSKLRSFADGWRHLRFMLLYSPFFLFFVPGLILFLLGFSSMFWLYLMSPAIFGIKLSYHPMFVSAVFVVIGYQVILFSLFAKTYAITHLGEENRFIQSLYKYVTIEKASLAGILVVFAGTIIYIMIFLKWIKSGFGVLQEIKLSVVALTLIAFGVQTIFSSFMLSILGIKEK